MKSYDTIFEISKIQIAEAELTTLYNSFRDNPGPYQFLTATSKESRRPDTEALTLAKQENLELYNKYLQKEKPAVGYADLKNYVPVDSVDSRHIFMNTMIFSEIGKSLNNIVEIGGGFGNWARINYGIIYCKSWTIIDLGFVIGLQSWYLKNTEPKIVVEFVEADDFNNVSNWSNEVSSIDLVIGAHSLSEVSFEIFKNYFNSVLPKANYLFYSTHTSRPSKELIEKKLELLEEKFNPIKSITSENGKVYNVLYKNKFYE